MREQHWLWVMLLITTCTGNDQSPAVKATAPATTATGTSTTAPRLELAAPMAKQYFTPDEEIVIVARLQPTTAVKQLDFLSNNATIGTLTAPPFRFTYRLTTPGQYVLQARAQLQSGQQIESLRVPIVIREPGPEGEVSDTGSFPAMMGKEAAAVGIIEPASGAQITSGTDVSIVAEAGSTRGQIQRVTFLIDGEIIGVRAERPYKMTWRATPGRHVITARAIDSAGNEDQSRQIEIRVSP